MKRIIKVRIIPDFLWSLYSRITNQFLAPVWVFIGSNSREFQIQIHPKTPELNFNIFNRVINGFFVVEGEEARSLLANEPSPWKVQSVDRYCLLDKAIRFRAQLFHLRKSITGSSGRVWTSWDLTFPLLPLQDYSIIITLTETEYGVQSAP